MAQTRVANLHRGLRDVVVPGLQQFRGALDPQLAQVLWNSHAGFLREGAAQMERTAAYLTPDRFQAGRLDEVTSQDRDNFLRSLVRQPLLTIAKQLVFASAQKEILCH